MLRRTWHRGGSDEEVVTVHVVGGDEE